ncbi:hypothetical protein HMPREF0973_02551 [Prevotella veroralis F0319]|uniref:Uncharacterized protein n=1 Tax=Prevotella veroralis F0319 TaxID=649761 RepID=C9MSD2_9BACT|nr:hypothetical protein HMPREF0973_02551 [Prevotella veroralis F0319]
MNERTPFCKQRDAFFTWKRRLLHMKETPSLNRRNAFFAASKRPSMLCATNREGRPKHLSKSHLHTGNNLLNP